MLRIFLSGLFIIFSAELLPQDPLVIDRITGVINFDGIPDEEAWQQVQPLKMVMHSPDFGKEPTETSVVKVAYDDEYLYFSGILNYKDPSDIRAIARKRDYNTPFCDWFGILLDSFNDRKNGISFWTNPNGLRTDGTVQNDLADSNTDISFDWNTFWDVKTVISDKGWSAEFKIPFSSMRFQTENGKTLMGLAICWYLPAKSEMNTFPSIPPNFPAAYWKPSLSRLIEFRDLQPKKPVYLTPYATTGIGQVSEINELGTGYSLNSKMKYDAGLDAKFSLTNNLTLDLTANTDFAQVEADDQKINLTRFSLYFPEKRAFFQEKSDVFDFSFMGGNYLFDSRRIGLYEGNPVRIYGGFRMTGRVNNWDIGILDLQTATYENNPGENFGIFRTKKTIFNKDSYIGGMFTSRLGMNGNYNLAYGLDGQFRVTGDEYLTIKFAQTYENDSISKFFDKDPSRLLVYWERRNLKGFGYNFLYSWSGDQFNPGIGFEVKDNYQVIRAIFKYGWFPGESNPIRYQNISLTGYNIWNTSSGIQETATGILMWEFETKKGSSGSAGMTFFQEDLTDSLSLGNNQAYVPQGRYPFVNFSASYGTSSRNALSAFVSAGSGAFYDGWLVSIYAWPRVNIGSGIYLGLTYNLDYVTFPSRNVNFTNHITGLKGMLTLTTKTSLSAFIQYNTSVNKVSANIRFRYNPREGNDFYLVYDEGLNTRLTRETPTLPVTSGRTILLKYSYTFRF
jgi:hypothetical protein